MPKYIEMPEINSHEDMALETYPGELLSDTIARAMDNGVSPEMGAPVIYDEDEEYGIDPDCDIRTDRFLIAEMAEHQRSAAEAMSQQAEVVQTITGSEPVPVPEPVSDPEPVKD